jgi:Flp pilus assembly protein CpaB
MFHQSPRALALRFAAVVVAVVTAGLVASDLASLHRRAHDFGPERSALVARRDLAMGTTIRAHDVRTRPVHSSQLPSGVLIERARVVGRVVVVPVLRDGFVADRNLAPRKRTGLDGAVPRGMRAVRVVATDSLVPRPGAAVDVIASYESDPLHSADNLTPSDAVVVAHGVLVLDTSAAQTADGAGALGVTLLVTPDEARQLVFAATHGVITLALVPPESAKN